MRSGQTNMILIVILLLMFIVLALFLLSLARPVSQEDYMKLYVNNLLLSVMRTDTGFSDSNCRLISDATACAFILPDWRCGDSGLTCLELANDSLSDYMGSYELISKNYRYLFVITSEGFISRTGYEQGEGMRLVIGDQSLESASSKRTSTYVIQKSLAGSQYNIRVLLKLARKTG